MIKANKNQLGDAAEYPSRIFIKLLDASSNEECMFLVTKHKKKNFTIATKNIETIYGIKSVLHCFFRHFFRVVLRNPYPLSINIIGIEATPSMYVKIYSTNTNGL